MAKVDTHRMVDSLSPDIKRALTVALNVAAPDAEVDAAALHKALIRALRQVCVQWKRVPDSYVKD